MFKNVVIFILAVYSGYLTIKYIQINDENKALRLKLFEYRQLPPVSDSSGKKIFEVEARRDTIYLTRFKKVVERDTIFVYQVVPSETGEYRISFTWTWLEFLRLKDTILIRFDSLRQATANLYRFWAIERPLDLVIEIYERKPEELWWRGYVAPPEFANYTDLRVYNSLGRFRWYIGGGVSFNDRVSPLLGTSIVYSKHLLGLDVALNNISLYYKYRFK